MLTRNLLAGKSRSFEVILLPGQKSNTTNFSLCCLGSTYERPPDTLFSAIRFRRNRKKGFSAAVVG